VALFGLCFGLEGFDLGCFGLTTSLRFGFNARAGVLLYGFHLFARLLRELTPYAFHLFARLLRELTLHGFHFFARLLRDLMPYGFHFFARLLRDLALYAFHLFARLLGELTLYAFHLLARLLRNQTLYGFHFFARLLRDLTASIFGLTRPGLHLTESCFGIIRLFLSILTEEQRPLGARYDLFNLKLAAFFRLAGPGFSLFGSGFSFARTGLSLGFARPGLSFGFCQFRQEARFPFRFDLSSLS